MAVTQLKRPAAGAPAKKKSGIRSIKPGEVIFKENDPAQSLYIIQKGQIRLYRPKGRGFIDLAILRTGEVIGEMAYFDQKASRRSCSAEAMVTTEVIEISFTAFEKTMAGLNPWFKTIINTLADRLRKTNEKVKNLETNSVGFSQGGKVGGYKFFHNIDIIRMLSMLYLNFAASGEVVGDKTQIKLAKINFYMIDMFNIQEVKVEEFLQILAAEDYIELVENDKGRPEAVATGNYEKFRSIMAFINAQRALEDAKQLKVSAKCERLLKRIFDQLDLKCAEKEEEQADLTTILNDFKERSVPIGDEDLADAVEAGLCGDIIVGSGNRLTCTVQYLKLQKIFPAIRLQNAIRKANEANRSRINSL